jgi:hypothetical protein
LRELQQGDIAVVPLPEWRKADDSNARVTRCRLWRDEAVERARVKIVVAAPEFGHSNNECMSPGRTVFRLSSLVTQFLQISEIKADVHSTATAIMSA